MIRELGNPVISMSARLPDVEEAESAEELFSQFEDLVDIIIDDEGAYHSPYTGEISTMIDLTDDVAVITRVGLGIELAEQYV
jgi:tRNA A37 threonylcarbamoyladenosine synthetase subunit TsaC/SUA5/YrdC